MLSDKKIVEILDKAYNLMSDSKAGRIANHNEIFNTTVYSALVGYMIAEEERESRPQQLNG